MTNSAAAYIFVFPAQDTHISQFFQQGPTHKIRNRWKTVECKDHSAIQEPPL